MSQVALLMNFGDNTRVIHDIDKIPVVINIGESRKIDLDDYTAGFIKKSQPTDTLMMVPISAEMPPKLQELLSIMQALDNTFYDEILERCTNLLGPKNLPEMRPSRAALRSFLKDIAIVHSRDLNLSFEGAIKIVAAEKEQRRVIKDDVDPLKLQRELEEAEDRRRAEQPVLPPKLSQRERMDNSLGVLMAEELGAPLDPSAPPPAPFVDIEEFDQTPSKPPKVLGKRGPKPKPKADKSAFKPKGNKKSVRRVKV